MENQFSGLSSFLCDVGAAGEMERGREKRREQAHRWMETAVAC